MGAFSSCSWTREGSSGSRFLNIMVLLSILAFMVSVSVQPVLAACGGEAISYTSRQMSVGGTQTLSVGGARAGVTYGWEIASGGGSLSASGGTSVVYTAPGSNPNCTNNPKINLFADGAKCDTLTIGVNGYVGHYYYEDEAYETLDKLTCGSIAGWPYCRGHWTSWYCDGTVRRTGYYGDYSCGGSVWTWSCFNTQHGCSQVEPGCCYDRVYSYKCWPPYMSHLIDKRSQKLKTGGCCAAALIPEEPPPPACDVEVSSFEGTASTLHPLNGGSVSFSGSISSSQAFHWTITVAGRKIGEGTAGGSISATWDGRDASGKVVKPGKHTATLSVATDDGQCSAGRNLTVTVKVSGETDCKLIVSFGSYANLASGSLHHAQTLFSVPGSRWMPDLTLSYSSTDGTKEALGTGWTHTYSESLYQDAADDTYLYVKGTGVRQVLHRNGDVYTPENATYPTLARNADGSFVLQEKDLTRRLFDAQGKLASVVDTNGNAVSLSYDVNGRLGTVTDPAGRAMAFAYDAGGRIVSVTDPIGNVHGFTYSGDHLVQVSSPSSPGGSGTRIWSYTYDDLGFLLTKTDPDGNATRYVYDENHRIREAVDPEGRIRTVLYDPATNTTRFTEKDEGVWAYRYDTTLGVLTEKTDPLGKTTRYEYDSRSNLTKKTEPDGTFTGYTYDGNDNVLTVTDPSGGVTAYAYNALNLVTSVTDARGKTTSYGYDQRGNLTSVTDPTGGTAQYQYDARGNATKITDPLGNMTHFSYDAAGNLASVTDPEGNTTQLAYDVLGNVTSRTDALGNKTQFQYDNLNRLINLTDPLGHVTRFVYDARGNRTSVADANGNATQFAYNSQDQVTRITDALGNVTTLTYGGAACPGCGGGVDKLTAVTDAKGQRTAYEYDPAGRLIKETDPLGNVTTYAYDFRGNLATKTNPDGKTSTYAYDASNRLIRRQHPDGSITQYGYDVAGNMTYAGNQHIAYQFEYDANNRIAVVTDSNARTLRYQYDLSGRRTSMTTPDGGTVHYSYTANSQLAHISTIEGNKTNIHAYRYDAMNRRTQRELPNGTKTLYRYDANSRLMEIAHKGPRNRIVGEIKYTHDNVGNRIEKTIDHETIRYGYDPIYRLTQAETIGRGRKSLHGHVDEAYAYDPVGNRITGPKMHDVYSHDAANELLTDRHHQYVYDPNGNLIRKTRTYHKGQNRTMEFVYDDDNRLVRVTIRKNHKTREITYTYDPFGRRISKTISRDEIEEDGEDGNDRGDMGSDNRCEDGNKDHPRTTTYLYDGSSIILEYNQRNEVARRYLHGPNIDEPLSVTEIKRHRRHDTQETYYYHADGLGSVTGLTDDRGHVVQRYEYDSFGNIRQHVNRIRQPYTFTGREYDDETGLYFHRARYYDPQIGRFINRDPIGFAARDVNLYAYVDSVGKPFRIETNLYAYASNNPVNLIDPEGLQGQLPPGAGIGIKALVDYFLVRPEISRFVQDPAGRRIVSSAISGALTYGTLGAVGGATVGTGFGPGGTVSGALVGGLGGTISGFASGLLTGTLEEVSRHYATQPAKSSGTCNK